MPDYSASSPASASALTAAKRLARSLLVISTLHSSASERGVQQLDDAARSHRYRARLRALAHLLINPGILRIGMQQAMRARYLLSWARVEKLDAPLAR